MQLDLSPLIAQIAGTEWFVIIMIALVLLLGPSRLPQFSRALGKAAGEYDKAKQTIRREMEQVSNPINFPAVRGAVNSEREKLELIASSLGISSAGMSDEELRATISERMKV